MKTLQQACMPRQSVFDENKRDDVLELTDLIQNRIDPNEFFNENFVTEGMKLLVETAFKRFHGKSSSGLIKLTQSMGGGKTHNMISLALLAKYPEVRKKVLGNMLKDSYLGEVKVVGFTGRESDAEFGIWGAIAEQLGKKDKFKNYYSPLQAPGQTAWVNLLKGQPLLILLDELPPYLVNAKSKAIGDSNLSVVTITALANLFNALGKEELSNVCVVVSDLKATYESGSEQLQSTFKELEGEVNRSALNIEPVGTNSDDIYNILKKRLFEEIPSDEEITEIANAYKSKVSEAKQMGYTNISPEQIFIGIKDSYPFHPSLKDLYARFRENPGFQQTRGLIRLMRVIVSQIYTNGKSEIKYIINPYDMDLNDSNMIAQIKSIKPSLTNAISHDIQSNGKGIAEIIDNEMNNTNMSDLSKLILVSSLADVPHAILGLSESEMIGYLVEPNKDIRSIKTSLGEFTLKAWYIYTTDNGRIFFQNTKNMIAELNTLIESYDNDTAKKQLRGFLASKFKPSKNTCYQNVEIFPAIDEIKLEQDKVTLVLFEPNPKSNRLSKELQDFYDYIEYKNRVMFLSGNKYTMDKLIQSSKEYKGMESIIAQMDRERIAKNNPQYQQAQDKLDKIKLSILQSARETFCKIYYPSSRGLTSADFLMEFKGNNYDGEEQIIKVLTDRKKFETDVSGDTFRKKCEDRIFTQKEMRFIDIKRRAATEGKWQWHIPSALEELKNAMVNKDIWRENGGYIQKGPFIEKTEVSIQETYRDSETGEVTLKIKIRYGDKVYYDTNNIPTKQSMEVVDLDNFKTKELKINFLCIDSTGTNETGEVYQWNNKIDLKYNKFNKNNKLYIELKSIPTATIKYTTDGSNPKEHGYIYYKEFEVPDDCLYVLVIAQKDGIESNQLNIKIDKNSDFQINKDKPLILSTNIKINETANVYKEIDILKKHNVKVSDVLINLSIDNDCDKWIELVLGKSAIIEAYKLESEIENIRQNLLNGSKVDVELNYYKAYYESGQSFLDMVADKKMTLGDFKEEEIDQ